MCVMSMVGDHWGERFPKQYPWIQPIIFPQQDPKPQEFRPIFTPTINVPKEEFDALKKEVEIMKELLIKAKIYDEKNNEPNCEVDEKMELLKKIATIVGIDLDEVLKKKSG
jgi:hypothetical protein